MVPLPPPYDLTSLAGRLAGRARPTASADPTPRAAVAVVFRDAGLGRDAELLFIRRAERIGDPWSGHMAFPGGRRAPGDTSLLATAVRETFEEVGIDLEASGTLLTELTELPAVARHRRANLIISPFVFALHRGVEFTLDHAEVAEALWAPVGPLTRGEGTGTLPYEFEGRILELPCLHIEGRVVWGLTYRMMQMVFDALEAPAFPR